MTQSWETEEERIALLQKILKDLDEKQRLDLIETGYRRGLEAAAQMAHNWGDQAGERMTGYGSGYHNLGRSIAKIDPAKGY